MTHEVLAIIWFGIVCVEVALYFMLDGANLGIGILSLFPDTQERRDRSLRGLGPIWNANETWLLVAAGTLFGAFPAVYALGLNALFVPAMVAGVGLIVRAVSFGFYEYATGTKELWARTFSVGSFLVAIGHGFLLGGLLSGIRIVNGRFGGTMWDWATPLTFLLTVGVVASYIVLGYARVLQDGMEEIRGESFIKILGAVGVTLVALIGATLILPMEHYTFFARWTTPPASTGLMMIVFVIAVFGILMVLDIVRGHKRHVYTLALGVFACGFIGMIIGMYPYVMPGELTIFDVASPSNTLTFMLYGIGPLLPIIFAYNWYLHRVFKGEWKMR